MSKKKKLLFILIAILFAESVHSQIPGEITLKLSSIPPGGLLLKDGWTFHAVDDSNVAKYNYEASQGMSVNPTLQLDQIPVVRRSGIGWFRLKLDVDSSFQNKTIGINLSMLG